MLALLGAHHFLHVSRIRDNTETASGHDNRRARSATARLSRYIATAHSRHSVSFSGKQRVQLMHDISREG